MSVVEVGSCNSADVLLLLSAGQYPCLSKQRQSLGGGLSDAQYDQVGYLQAFQRHLNNTKCLLGNIVES